MSARDALMDDFDDLSEEEENDSGQDKEGTTSDEAKNYSSKSGNKDVSSNNSNNSNDDGKTLDVKAEDGLASKLASLQQLVDSKDFNAKVSSVRKLASMDAADLDSGPAALKAYQMVVEANNISYAIEDEVARIHGVLTEVYGKRFPELQSHVPDPRAYARVVKLIGNESDMTSLDLSSVLTATQSMAVSMTGSRLKTEALGEHELLGVMKGCDAIENLEDVRKNVLLPFVASRMAVIAPNMTALLGSEITAQVLGVAGGLEKMVQIPSCNVMVLGKGASALNGFSRVAAMRHFGVLYGCPLVQECLAEHRKKAMRVVSGRVALAARLDHTKSDQSGAAGKSWYEEIRGKLEKWHAPPPGKTKRALPVPQTISKKRRGGRRARAVKERLGMTDTRREMNRVNFGEAEADEYGDSAMGNTFGRLGKGGSGQMRLTEKVQKHKKIDFAHYKHDNRSAEAKARQEIMDRLRDNPVAALSDSNDKEKINTKTLAQDDTTILELNIPSAITDKRLATGDKKNGSEGYFSNTFKWKA